MTEKLIPQQSVPRHPHRAWKFSDPALRLDSASGFEPRRATELSRVLTPAASVRAYASPVGMNVSRATEKSGSGAAALLLRMAPMRVLVVDDEEQLRRVTQRILEHAGFRVVTAVDGEGALKEIRESSAAFDVVLSDVMMPAMDGIELAVRVRAEFPDLPFVFMTGVSDVSRDRERSGDICEAIVSKPFEVGELVETLRQAAGGAS